MNALQLVAATGSNASCTMDWGQSEPVKDWLEKSAPKRSKAPPLDIKSVSVLDMSARNAVYRRKHLYLRLCRSKRLEAEIYEQFLFLFQQKHGKPRLENRRYDPDGGEGLRYWWGKRREDWAAHMGCTVKQFDYALAHLREWGLVCTRSAKTPTKMLQVRVTVAEGAGSLNGWPDEAAHAHLKSAVKQKPICSESLAGQGSKSEKCEIAISEKCEIAISENSEIKALDGGSRLKEVDEEPGRPKTGTPLTTTGEIKSAEAKPNHPEAARESIPEAQSSDLSNKVSAFVSEWTRTFGVDLDGDSPEVRALRGQVRRICAAAGPDWRAFLVWLKARSSHLAWDLRCDQGIDVHPGLPGFIRVLATDRNLQAALSARDAEQRKAREHEEYEARMAPVWAGQERERQAAAARVRAQEEAQDRHASLLDFDALVAEELERRKANAA